MTTDEHIIAVPRLGSIEDVVDIGQHLGKATTVGTALLDLRPLSTGSVERDRYVRVNIEAAFLLTQLLVTRYRSTPLEVRLPTTPSLLTQLARAGILFALAHHRRLAPRSWDGLGEDARSIWSSRWVATEGIGQLELFRRSVPPGPHADLTAFVDVHQSPSSVVDRELVSNGVRPWLRRRALKLGVPLAPFEAVRADAERSVAQLVDNIRDHAELEFGGASLVEVGITRGHDDQLYLVVLDSGIGVPTSASKRLHDVSPGSTTLVQDALRGALPLYDRDRARGLSIVRDIADRHRGRLFLATAGGSDVAQDAAVTWRSDPSGERAALVPGLPLAGTLIIAQLPMPRLPARETGTVADEPLPVTG